MNNYCVETSNVTGKYYEEIYPDEEAREYHLNGIQAVSYARIRYTAGNDMKRTQRQRVVINKIIDKVRNNTMSSLKPIVNDVIPNCRTSIPVIDILSYLANIQDYEIEKTSGFPFIHIEKYCSPNGTRIDPVVPVTLEQNVTELHKFLFNEEDYTPNKIIQAISSGIEEISGLDENDLEFAKENSIIEDSGGEADVVI